MKKKPQFIPMALFSLRKNIQNYRLNSSIHKNSGKIAINLTGTGTEKEKIKVHFLSLLDFFIV